MGSFKEHILYLSVVYFESVLYDINMQCAEGVVCILFKRRENVERLSLVSSSNCEVLHKPRQNFSQIFLRVVDNVSE